MNTKQKGGFTLIELIVVAAIISLLTSIVLAALSDAKAKGRDAGKIRAMTETRTALQMFFSDKGYFPLLNTPPSTTWKDDLINGGYIKSINSNIIYKGVDPSGAECNSPATNCISYHIGVVLEKSNKVLNSDKDVNLGGFHGGSTACNPPPGSTPDLCYDLTP